MSSDPIGNAIRADAEAARQEIRAEGIICPSCGVNMADLPEGHALVIAGDGPGPWSAECRDGMPVILAAEVPMADAAHAQWQAAANISLYDDFRRREAAAFRDILGIGRRA